MLRSEQIRIAKRLLAHLQNGTAESAPQQLRVDVSEYIDPALWEQEVEHFYKRMPIVAGMSCELPQPGTYMALDIVDVPVLLVRGQDNVLRAFLNVCRHRGSPVVAAGCGEAKRFSCLYHGWTYDQTGRLVGVSEEQTFGKVDRGAHGLTALPCGERAGLIFVGLTPGTPFDLDAHLAGVDKHLSGSAPETYHYGGGRVVEAPNWKIVIEGHLESYHFANLHRESLAPFSFSNCATIDRFGPHILITFARKAIMGLLDIPESEWEPLRDGLITPQYILFPGAAITFTNDSLFSQIIHPAGEVGRSTNRMVAGFFSPPDDPETVSIQQTFLDYVSALVSDEDYMAGRCIQQGMRAGAQPEILFGRNEPGPIYFHEIRNAALKAATDQAQAQIAAE